MTTSPGRTRNRVYISSLHSFQRDADTLKSPSLFYMYDLGNATWPQYTLSLPDSHLHKDGS